jgi:hypothetical protein
LDFEQGVDELSRVAALANAAEVGPPHRFDRLSRRMAHAVEFGEQRGAGRIRAFDIRFKTLASPSHRRLRSNRVQPGT